MDNKVLDLLEIRDQIDGIDKEIVELFEKRMQLSAEVAEYKISNNKAGLRGSHACGRICPHSYRNIQQRYDYLCNERRCADSAGASGISDL